MLLLSPILRHDKLSDLLKVVGGLDERCLLLGLARLPLYFPFHLLLNLHIVIVCAGFYLLFSETCIARLLPKFHLLLLVHFPHHLIFSHLLLMYLHYILPALLIRKLLKLVCEGFSLMWLKAV